jgi:thiol:disulfide interchange protein DsbD
MNYRHNIFILILAFVFSATLAFAFDPNFNFNSSQNPANPGVVTVSATVSPGHMLYRHQMSFSASAGEIAVTWPAVVTKADPFGEGNVDVYPEGTHVFEIAFSANAPLAQSTLTVKYQGCSALTCFMPTQKKFELTFAPPVQPASVAPGQTQASASQPAAAAIDSPAVISEATTAGTGKTGAKPENAALQTTSAPVQVELSQQDIVDFSAALEKQGIHWVLLLALIGGLLVSLTPCVYPMIPITLSIIGSRDENVSFYKGLGLSATYVAGLSLTYALLGLAAATFGAQIRGFIQGPMFQGLVAVIFFLLALSMFDLIMLQAPAALRNRLGGIKKTGIFGIFVMGMVSGLMASPCVAAPLAGILAFIAATGSQALGFFMLLLFAWGMSVPLLLIGAFSGSLNAMPRAGEWMNRVKEFYGFLLLAAALYFAKPIIGIAWAELGIAALLASFAAFLGLFHNVPEDAGMRPRVFKSFGVVAIAVACAFAISAASQWGCLCLPKSAAEKQENKAETFWQHDLQTALKEAAATGKPLFLDFRADWCTVCKDLELNVFPRPEIRSLLGRMVPVKIDATSPDDEKVNALLKQFGIVGLPTLVILQPDGNEITSLRTVGFISPEHLEKKLRAALP